MEEMNTMKSSRLILALRACGWTDTEINNLVLYLETGEENWFERVAKKEK